MEIERFKYHEKFSIKSQFLDTALDVEGTLDEGETLKEAVAKAREEIIKALSKQDNNAELPEYKKHYRDVFMPEITTSIPVISKENERLEIQIDNAKSLEELSSLKETAGKAGLVSAYMHKLNELTNNI